MPHSVSIIFAIAVVALASLFPGADGLGRSLSEAALLHGETIRNHKSLQDRLIAETQQLRAEHRDAAPTS